MDLGDPLGNNGFDVGEQYPRKLPADLPKSLNDRMRTPPLPAEAEMYDGWQGESHFITAPVPARLDFNLGIEYRDEEEDVKGMAESERRLESMMAAQAAFKVDSLGLEDEDGIVSSAKLPEREKREMLQKTLNMAASNGDEARVIRILEGKARQFVDINAPDEEGTSPLIYASCFGHEAVVQALLNAGADVDQQDRHQWSSLMWAMTNRHKGIAKLLLDHGASPEIKSQSGRTAFDFVEPESEISGYLHENGYIGSAGVVDDDFYDSGLAHGRFEEEMAENEMRRRMMMESAINLEVDLSSLGLDEQPEASNEYFTPEGEEEEEEGQEFVWDRCLHDQMFVFQEHELEKVLDVVITNMTPQRSPTQKPVPANVLFLSARYAHYHSSPDLLSHLLLAAMEKINLVVERHQWDMTILAFWLSNATLLLYYLKKDSGLVGATINFQQQLSELINEIFILITRDAERRMDKVLDTAMLEHETIPGFEDVHFQNEWRLFKSKRKSPDPGPLEKRFRPPSPKQRAKPSPRNITSLLSSTLFVLDLYDIHSVITSQLLGQLFYWLGSELFNRIMSNRKYLARTKAMQIRLNVSTLEDWARTNSRQPEHFETGSLNATGETTIDAAKRHLSPVIQLLQWLQCFSSLGEDFPALKATIDQLPRLSPQQLLHATKNYRPEVGEKGLTREAMTYLVGQNMEFFDKKAKRKSLNTPSKSQKSSHNLSPTTPTSRLAPNLKLEITSPPSPVAAANAITVAASLPLNPDDDDPPDNLLMDPALMLPFSLPTSTDMLVTYGAGWGGVNKERAKKYSPTVPPEFLNKLDFSSQNGDQTPGRGWRDGDD
ncbi:DIL domain-containing protein [Geopyxis carbonaria]|nr:DIL domain-containing protein [Geopyxis carbonaria]